jgi:hypothetical protein
VLLSLAFGAASLLAQPAPKLEAARTLVRAGHLLRIWLESGGMEADVPSGRNVQ